MDNSSLGSTHEEILSEPVENTCARVAGFMHWVPELFWLRLVIWFTLLCFLGQPVVTLANIIAAPTTPLTTVNTTVQGRELVNINTPNQNGVSFNQYQRFDVNKNGAVLNNNNGGPQANQNVALQQGSFANGNFVADRAAANPNLGQRHAKLILNQVTSTNPSQLNGPLEVAGQKADVIIANPNGITCNGCGFINTTRGVLTTGQLNDNGGTGWGVGGNSQLSNIPVAQGKITVASGGLVDYQTPQIDIIARGISIQGQIQGRQGGRAGLGDGTAVAVNKLNLIAGENTVRLTGPTGQMGRNNITTTQPYSNTNPNQDLEIINTSANTVTDYIDVGRLGGMYAHSIFLASTTKGVGVNSAGTIYSINDVEIAANGQVHLGRAGTNPDGSTGYGSVESGYYTDINRTNTNDPRGNGSITIVGATGTTQTADGSYAADAVDNANGTLRAHGGDILIRAASFDNTAGTVAAVGGNDVTGTAIGSAIDIMTNGLVINQQGSLQANSDTLTIEALGIDNTRGGIIYTASDMSLDVGTAGINNSAVNNNPAGLINADRKIELNTTGALLNRGGGTLQAKQNVLNATANNIDNTNGGIFKSGTDIRLTAIAGDIDNRQGGLINAGNGSNGGGGHIQLYAKQGWLRNSNAGQIKSDKDYVSITAARIDNSARGVLRALQDINMTAQQGDIDNHLGGIIDASGQVRLTAAQGALLNAAGSVQSRQGLTIQSQRIDNTAGLLQDIDKGNLDITTGALNNLAGNYTAADGSVSVGGKISSQTGTIVNLTATDLINSGVINSGNTDPYASPASITIHGNFTNSGLIQGRQDLKINFQHSPSQVNSGTIASGRDLIIKNASYFTNLGQADSSGRCGGLCAGNDLILTGGQVINNGMMRALGSIYLGFDPTDSTANTAGLSRLQNLLGAAIIAVKGSIKARVNGADFAPAANGQGVDPVALQNAQTALTNAQAAQTTANAALQNSQALVGNLNTLATTADNLNDIQGGSLTAVLERGKYDSLQLQTTATSLSSEATNTLLNNSNLSTGAISAANSADTTAKEIYTQTGTTMVQTDSDAQGNPIMSSIAVGTGKVTNAETALSDARSFFGWGDNALTDVVAPANSATNAPVPKLSDYITNLTNLKNNTNGANNTALYQAVGCASGATATCDQKLQTLIDSLQALQTANQNVTTQINSGTTTVAQLISAGTTDISTKQTTADAAALTTAQAQAAVITITGPVANSQALQTAQNDVNAKQAAVDQINNNNSSLVQQAAADQAALAVANANQIDAAKALTNAQNLQKDLDTLSRTAGGLAAINGAGSITDNALAVQSQASLMLQASNRIALAASDPSLTDTGLKSAVTALANSANQNASTSSAAANALLARLDHSFALADQTPVNNLNATNQNANTLVASINTRLQSLTDYIKTVQGQPQAAALETVASKLVALRDAAGALASSASNPVSPAASSSTPADPPLTATQKASATQHAVDGLQAAVQEVNTSLSTLSAFTANDPTHIGALLTDSSNFVNTAKTDANNSKQAKLTLASAIDTQFRADPVNQTLIQQMLSANQAAAGNQTTANNLNTSAANQINLKQTANAQAITTQVAAQTTADNSAAQVDAIQNQLIAANNDLVNSIVAMSKVAGASALVSGQPAIHNIGTIYAGQDITLAVNPKQGEKATIFNESHQDAAGNQDGGLIQAGRSISLGRDCGLDSNGLCTQTLWNNTNGGSAGIVEVNNTAAIRTTGVNKDGIAWGSGGDINIQAEIFHNSIVDPGVTNNEGAHTRVYEGDSGRYGQGIDPLVHLGTHGGYVMGNTPSWNNSVDIQNAQTNTAIYASAVAGATAALAAATTACLASLGLLCAGVPIAAAGLVTAQLSYTGAFYKDFTETWVTTQSFNTPLSKARPNITAAHNLVIRELNGTNIGGTLAAGNNVTITPIDGIAGKGTFINKALVLQKFDYTLYGRTESKCGMGDTACTGGPIQTLGDVLEPLGAPVTSTLVINGIQQSYGGIIQALNGTAGITVGTLINIGATDPDGNAPDTGIAGLSVTSSTQLPAALVGTKDNAAIDSGHGAIS